MLDFATGWFVCTAIISLAGAACFFRLGARAALGVAVALSFAAPVWLEVPIIGVPFSVQTSVAAVFLLAFVIRSPWEIRSPLVLLDGIVAGLVVLQIASDIYHGSGAIRSGLMGYGEWALPYVAGRFAARDPRNLELIGLILAGIVLVLGLGGFIESVFKINLWEIPFGERPLDGTNRDTMRLGFRRAYGTTLHPIFFALLILVLIPWSVALWKWGQNLFQRNLAVASMVAGTLGILGSISRAPILGLLGFYAITAFMWWKASRWILAGVAVLAAIWGATDFNAVLSSVESMAGEQRRMTNLRLDGERVELSAAAARLWMLKVYWPALKETGLLGYGTVATSTLPPEVPYLPKDETTRQQLRFVDNAYLMFGLRFGWTGMALYSLLLLTAIYTGIQMAWDRSIGVISGALAAMTIAIAFNMISVWFSYDMGFAALWSFGVLGGLASHLKS